MKEYKTNIVHLCSKTFITIWSALIFYFVTIGFNAVGQVNNQATFEIDNILTESRNEFTKYNYLKAIELAKLSLDKSNKVDYYLGRTSSLLLIGESMKSNRDYSNGLNYYLQALSEIEKTDNHQNLYKVHNKIGQLFFDWGVPEKALTSFNEAKGISQSISNEITEIELLVNIAETCLKLNHRLKALDEYQAILILHKKNENKQQTITTLKKIASIHNQLDEYEHSLKYNFEILAIYEQAQDSVDIAVTLNTIGFLYKDIEDLPNALMYFNRALTLNQQMNKDGVNDNNIVSNLINIGVIHQSMGAYRSSIESFNDALKVKEKTGSAVEIAVMHNYLASIYYTLQNYNEARKHSIEAIEILKSSENKKMLAANYKRLSDIHQKLGNYQSALNSYKQYSLIQDSVLYHQQLVKEKEQYKQFVIETTEKESKLNIIDREMRELELRNEKVKSEKEKQEIELLLREQELQNSSLRNEQLVQERKVQRLLLQQEQIETATKSQEIILLEQKRDLQAVELQKNELLENERRKEIELQNSKLELQQSQLEQGKIRQKYFIGTTIFFISILLLIIVSYFIKQRDNRKLKRQYEEINEQKAQIEDINAELVDLNEEKNNLIGIVAHDLKSPLNQISGILDIINLTAKDQTKEQQEYIAKIDQSSKRLKNMVTKILDVNAIESKSLNLHLELVDIKDLLKETVIRFVERAEKKQITINESFEDNVPPIRSDSSYVTEVFENLLSNSIKYSPLNKSVEIKLHQNGKYVRVEFIDEGEGIKKEDMKKLFGRYHKLSARPTAGEDSTGLGLSIVKKYVEALSGNVWCESEEGKGANFIVEFEKDQNHV